MMAITETALAVQSERTGHSIGDLRGKMRGSKCELAHARQQIMVALVESGLLPCKVATDFGVHHTTVMHARKVIVRRGELLEVGALIVETRKRLGRDPAALAVMMKGPTIARDWEALREEVTAFVDAGCTTSELASHYGIKRISMSAVIKRFDFPVPEHHYPPVPCAQCEASFHPSSSQHKFCSSACADRQSRAPHSHIHLSDIIKHDHRSVRIAVMRRCCVLGCNEIVVCQPRCDGHMVEAGAAFRAMRPRAARLGAEVSA